jgi:argininosuccinate lyase
MRGGGSVDWLVMADGGYLGAGGRLAGGPADELVEAAYAHELRAAPRLAYDLSLSDIAHAVALAEGGAVTVDTARTLIGGLLELHEIPVAEFPWQAALGDAFNSREAELVRRIGSDAAGWLSAGRPRREAFRVALRACARRGSAELVIALADAAGALAGHARDLRDSLAADYTYLQAAQPTTAGHLLLAYAYPALRDCERLQHAHRELSRSVAGVGGSAGSRWPLDRELLAGLLGCEGLVQHTKDAAWQWDVYAELLSTLAIAATHLSQLAQDFEIYASHEFGLIELADRHSRASALMPQKRNPYALAAIRTQAGQAAGDVSAALAVTHTGSARTDHFHLLNGLVPRALEEAGAIARLAAAVLAGLQVHAERMAQVAREGFTNAADVADVLASTGGMDYRTAHKVVGLAVRRLIEDGAGALTAEAVADATLELTGGSVAVDPAQLDPAACAQARLQTGSSSHAAMDVMLAEVDAQSSLDRTWATGALEAAAAAERRLLARARALATD